MNIKKLTSGVIAVPGEEDAVERVAVEALQRDALDLHVERHSEARHRF